MQLKVYTLEDLFELGKSIIRNETGVPFPFQKRTLHRALLRVASLFGADASIQTLRLTYGMTLDGLSGTLLERKGLEYFTPVRPATPARLIGKIIPKTIPAPSDITLAADQIVIRPATTTQSAIEFQLEAIATIPAGAAESNLVSAVCTVYGTKGNGIPSGQDLDLKYPTNDIDHFEVVEESGGGFEKQTDDEYRSSIRESARGRHESTWAGLEKLLKTIKLDSGHRLTMANVVEDFINDLVYVIVDDGSGVYDNSGPLDITTYDIAGHTVAPLFAGDATYWEYTEHNRSVDVQLPYYHLKQWNDGVTEQIKKYTALTGVWTDLTQNVDFYSNIDNGKITFTADLLPGDKIRVWFQFFTGLVGLAAKYTNGVVGDPVITGWRPTGTFVRIRPPINARNPDISATMVFSSGWDSQFGIELAQTLVITYLNSLQRKESAKYGIVNHIINGVPGVKSVEDLLIDGVATDCAPFNKDGVVRGNGIIL